MGDIPGERALSGAEARVIQVAAVAGAWADAVSSGGIPGVNSNALPRVRG